MTTYTTRVIVPADRTITIELPADMPEGEVEVEVTACAARAPKSTKRRATHRSSGSAADLLEWLRTREPFPRGYIPRTREQIDAEIQAMRDEWDR